MCGISVWQFLEHTCTYSRCFKAHNAIKGGETLCRTCTSFYELKATQTSAGSYVATSDSDTKQLREIKDCRNRVTDINHAQNVKTNSWATFCFIKLLYEPIIPPGFNIQLIYILPHRPYGRRVSIRVRGTAKSIYQASVMSAPTEFFCFREN